MPRLPQLTARELIAFLKSPGLFVFDSPDVARAGELPALKVSVQPADILPRTKERLFVA
jgi:hypothetical protein